MLAATLIAALLIGLAVLAMSLEDRLVRQAAEEQSALSATAIAGAQIRDHRLTLYRYLGTSTAQSLKDARTTLTAIQERTQTVVLGQDIDAAAWQAYADATAQVATQWHLT